ncbi:MAG: DNA polymerase [Eubacterium sp.]|jgi:hypothetical protein|nr:DNA polymerase [Eubacterium sp.]
MKNLSIDLECYSDIDLSKCGVYKYAESPAFEILLFGYAVNGGEVKVIDLASGETIPDDVLDALTDDTVIKWAFNANFERVCLSRYLRDRGVSLYPFYDHHPLTAVPARFLNPSGWHCSMVWAATLGLPLSLKGAGEVLKLEDQKMDEGKALIKYFSLPCTPTKANGGRKRNLPSDAPDKWETFKRYNKRDVEVEMAIQKRLSHFPVPDFVWDEYTIDQEINDRGVRLDMELVHKAIQMDEISKGEITEELKKLTGLSNPNSVMQLKDWLEEKGFPLESLGKKEVAAAIKEAPDGIKEVLVLRLQLAKSSVKKYQTMERAVCSDGRARGMFMFYGANRTGRWCLTGDHEVLTQDGWERLDEWQGGAIACWNATSEAVSFQKAEKLEFDYRGKMYTYQDNRIDQCSTPDHKMRVKKRYGGNWTDMTVEEMAKCQPCIPLNGYRYHRGCASPAWIRVLIMTQADGYYTADGEVRFHFKKLRKIARCKHLLRKAEISFVERENTNGTVTITIPARCVPLWLREFRTKTFGFWLLDENPDIFFDELPQWDGYCPAPNSIQYTTCNRQNADIVQALAHMSGRCASLRLKKLSGEHKNWKDAYILDIWLSPGAGHEIRVKPTITDYDGKVYCAATKTGYFLVRRNGKVWVTGNSGRLIQLQNLPQNHLPDLSEARALVRSGDFDSVKLLYEDVPDTLSQLIRTAFIPREGQKFYVADFSAIEARVIAWYAGETWKSEAFANGEDIYCSTASRMFGVPVVKHGVNGELRQKGKIAELACGYGGSTGALKAMGAIEMGLSEDELPGIVSSWRSANKQIVRFWWEVDRAVKDAVKYHKTTKLGRLTIFYQSGMLFITLPSGRKLAYARPRIGVNRFGGECVTYEGTGSTRKWERLESYGPKFVENIVQATSRDILCNSMKTLRNCSIVMHIHDELVIEADPEVSLNALCEQMGRAPSWAPGLNLRADGYTCEFYQKD